MLRKFFLLVPTLLALLAACSQAPAPEEALPELSPMTFGSSGYDDARGLAKHSSGVYAVGNTSGNLHGSNKGSYDAFVRKYDNDGAVVWGKQFGTPSYESAEGVAGDASNNAYVVGNTDSSGNLYFAGETYTNFAETNQGGGDGYVIKLTPSGSYAWRKQLGTSEYDATNAVLARNSSDIFAAGTTYGTLGSTNSGNSDAYLRRLRGPSGNTVWTDQ